MSDNIKKYGLLGKNISYSLSPVMHNAALNHFDISGRYEVFDKQDDELEKFFQEEVFSGKVPYKIKTKEILDRCVEYEVEYDGIVQYTGALNTVKVEADKIRVSNTDAEGFLQSLSEDAGFDPGGKEIFIVGAGGAGRMISLYLLSRDDLSVKVNVYDVDEGKLNSLQRTFGDAQQNKKAFHIVEDLDELVRVVPGCSLVVNATPLGMRETDPLPVPADLLRRDMTVYDLVYAHETNLVANAKEEGAVAVNGLGMLVNQAAMAFEKWTGESWKEVKKVMIKALPEDLKKVYGWNI